MTNLSIIWLLNVIYVKRNFMKKKNNYVKVRDHCHYTRKYRGAAHKICNIILHEKYQFYFIMEVVMIIMLS